jgi:geranylgeranyl transferase type-1 subunit beta
MTSLVDALRAHHSAYFHHHLHHLPTPYETLDSNRLTALYFCLSALDLLDQVPETGPLLAWVEAQRVPGGFRAGPFEGSVGTPHLAMTYSALCCLSILKQKQQQEQQQQHQQEHEGDLRAHRESTLDEVARRQGLDGGFEGCEGGEADMRFVFCAAAVGHLLGEHRCDVDRAVGFIQRCLTHEGGYSQLPGQEAHAGATYCALAALKLFNRLDAHTTPATARWLLGLQRRGFCGRCNKDEDTCYTWWAGASLKILQAHHLADADLVQQFLQLNAGRTGGYKKDEAAKHPDILHAYMGLAGGLLFARDASIDIIPELGLRRR